MRLLFLSTLVLCAGVCMAQSVSTQIGARANGIAYASAALFNSWSLFNNPAASAKAEYMSAGFTYDVRPAITGANRTAAIISRPLPVGVLSGSAYRFGDDLYNEHIISTGFANQFGLAALGVQVNYIQYAVAGFGNKGAATINLGGIAELTPRLAVGAYIVNVNQPTLSGDEKLPTRLVAGVAFKPTDKFFLAAELEKELDYAATLKMGMEYTFHKKFIARTGYALKPNTAFFGLGFKTKKFIIDYAVQYNVLLRLSHQASIEYQFARKP